MAFGRTGGFTAVILQLFGRVRLVVAPVNQIFPTQTNNTFHSRMLFVRMPVQPVGVRKTNTFWLYSATFVHI